MARKVVDVHRDKQPETLPELLSVYLGLKAELEQHMAKEEQILFPMIQSGQGSMATGPISVMEHEHDSAGGALRRLRELTSGYEVPAEACNTWRALWHGLAALEESLHQHIHLENNILFPRALGS
jgi:regulator of cell morphogenesis and NO signaling